MNYPLECIPLDGAERKAPLIHENRFFDRSKFDDRSFQCRLLETGRKSEIGSADVEPNPVGTHRALRVFL